MIQFILTTGYACWQSIDAATPEVNNVCFCEDDWALGFMGTVQKISGIDIGQRINIQL